MRGQILLCLILAVLYAFAFWAIRVPQWWFVGPVGAIAAIIPRLGSIVPVGLAALSLYLAHAPLSRYLLLVAVWLAVQGIEFFVLLPRSNQPAAWLEGGAGARRTFARQSNFRSAWTFIRRSGACHRFGVLASFSPAVYFVRAL